MSPPNPDPNPAYAAGLTRRPERTSSATSGIATAAARVSCASRSMGALTLTPDFSASACARRISAASTFGCDSLTPPSSHCAPARGAFRPRRVPPPPQMAAHFGVSGRRARRYLLESPGVSVGILEEDERPPAKFLHLGHVDTAREQ